MRARDARKLANGDQVALKSTGEVVKVLSVEWWPGAKPVARLECVGPESGHGWRSHDEVR